MNKTLLVSMISLLAGALNSSAAAKEFKVFILAGQSNMVGYGKTDEGRKPGDEQEKSQVRVEGGVGSLRYYVNQNKEEYGADGKLPLVDKDGKWIVRDDVCIYFTDEEKSKAGADSGKELIPLREGYRSKTKMGNLSVGYGKGTYIGPEFGFGNVIGHATDEPVLIIKTAWGGKDLGVDFRPPSSGPSPYKRNEPEVVGRYYRVMMAHIQHVLANYEALFPQLKGMKPKIAGFGWHQGWNDGGLDEMVAEYESNMANFIRDVRKDLGVKDLPFVIANSGMVGWREGKPKGRRENLCDIQLRLGDAAKHPEFAGTVAGVETRDFYRSHLKSPSSFGYHWHHNGESQFLIGKGMADAMLGLMK